MRSLAIPPASFAIVRVPAARSSEGGGFADAHLELSLLPAAVGLPHLPAVSAGAAARAWVAPSLLGVAAVALSVVGGLASLAMPPPPPVRYRIRRAPILPRGVSFHSIAAERLARKEVLARELVALLPPQVCEMLLGPGGYAQVPGAVERAEAVARIVLALGGPDGDGSSQVSVAP